jgi:hypothetical protein
MQSATVTHWSRTSWVVFWFSARSLAVQLAVHGVVEHRSGQLIDSWRKQSGRPALALHAGKIGGQLAFAAF